MEPWLAGSTRFRSYSLAVLVFAAVGVSCTRTPEQRAAQYLTSGRELLKKGEYSSALLQFKNAERFLPQKAEPLYYLGLVSIAQDQPREAIHYLGRATRVDPKYLPAQIK